MKERLTNNMGLKLLSLFLAFFLWLLVVNVSNPEIERSKEVQVEIVNEGVLTAAGQTYEIVGKDTVTVSYRVRTLDEYRISSSDFRAYIDLEDLYDVTGAVPVTVEVVSHSELIDSDSVSVKPNVIHVETEALQRKRFALEAKANGQPRDGYALGDVTINPEYVYVNGPISQVGQISYVGIEYNTEGAYSTIVDTTSPVFYDANGNQIQPGDRITLDTEEISFTQEVLKVKNVPLVLNVEGTVASGYRYTGLECSDQVIPVIGAGSASLDSIVIPAEDLNIEGASQTETVTLDIDDYIPDDVTIVGDHDTVTVQLNIEPLESITLSVDLKDIPETGRSDEYRYSFGSTYVDITVSGLAADLEALTVEDLGAQIDLAGLVPGENNGVLEFEENDTFIVTGYTPFTVIVTESGPEATSGSEETGGTGGTEAEIETAIQEESSTSEEEQ